METALNRLISMALDAGRKGNIQEAKAIVRCIKMIIEQGSIMPELPSSKR